MQTRLNSFALAFALLGALFMLPGSSVAQTNPFVNVPVTMTSPGGTFDGVLDISRFMIRSGQLVAVGALNGDLLRTDGTIRHVNNRAVAIPVDLARSVGTCDILNLVLGPLDLNLLGLEVHLDTVTLDIIANPAGGLLGDLLCSIANLLHSNGVLQIITDLLNEILNQFP
jgi:hypothetical protein